MVGRHHLQGGSALRWALALVVQPSWEAALRCQQHCVESGRRQHRAVLPERRLAILPRAEQLQLKVPMMVLQMVSVWGLSACAQAAQLPESKLGPLVSLEAVPVLGAPMAQRLFRPRRPAGWPQAFPVTGLAPAMVSAEIWKGDRQLAAVAMKKKVSV